MWMPLPHKHCLANAIILQMLLTSPPDNCPLACAHAVSSCKYCLANAVILQHLQPYETMRIVLLLLWGSKSQLCPGYTCHCSMNTSSSTLWRLPFGLWSCHVLWWCMHLHEPCDSCCHHCWATNVLFDCHQFNVSGCPQPWLFLVLAILIIPRLSTVPLCLTSALPHQRWSIYLCPGLLS